MGPFTRATTSFKVTTLRGASDEFHSEVTSQIRNHTATLVGNRVFVIARLLRQRSEDGMVCNCTYFDTKRLEWVWLNVYGPNFGWYSAVLVDEAILVYDDVYSSDHDRAYMWKLDLVSLDWCREEANSLPIIPDGSQCEFVEGIRKVVLFGGLSKKRKLASWLLMLDVDSNTWTAPKELGKRPSPRIGHSTCVLSTQKQSTIFICGGFAGGIYFRDLHALQVQYEACRWSEISVDPGCTVLHRSSIACVDNTLFIFGGYGNDHEDTDGFFAYNLSSKEWCDIHGNGKYQINRPVKQNSGHCLLPFHDGLLIVGGYGRSFPWVDTICAMD